MSIQDQIEDYLAHLNDSKRKEMEELHQIITEISPLSKIWFLDGKDENGKIVTNPNIGYGVTHLTYKDGSSKEFYKIGISANTSGISIYIMGLEDKSLLSKTFAEKLGKASITSYCIKFKTLKDIDIKTLSEVIQFGFEHN